jgi:hypothetical protein
LEGGSIPASKPASSLLLGSSFEKFGHGTFHHLAGSAIINNVFHIEKSQALIEAGPGIKLVEFVRMLTDRIMLLEVRTTFPNPEGTNTNSRGLLFYRLLENAVHLEPVTQEMIVSH